MQCASQIAKTVSVSFKGLCYGYRRQKQAEKAGDNLKDVGKDAQRNLESAADDAKGATKDAQRNVESGIDDARGEVKKNL